MDDALATCYLQFSRETAPEAYWPADFDGNFSDFFRHFRCR